MPRNVFDPTETLSSIQSKRRSFDAGYQNKALHRMRKVWSARHQRIFDTITGRDDGPIHALCCNGQVTEIVRNGLIDAMLCLFRQNNGRILRMVTIFNSPWRSDLYDTEIDLTDIQRRMRAVIAGCKFDGAFLKVEIQIAKDPIDGSFWAFPHAHGLALVSEDFEPRKTQERINKGGRLSHFNGANCLLISNRLQSEADVARVCAYSVKEPYSGMDFNPRTGKPDHSIGLMTGERCLRTTELLSSLRYNDVLIASGDLKAVRPRILRQLGPQKELQRATDAAARQAQDLWAELHSAGLRGNQVVANRGSALPRSSRTAGVMPVERRLSWATPSNKKRPRALSHNPDRSTGLFDAATMLTAPSLRRDSFGEFPDFQVAFTGRDDGMMHDVQERLRRIFSPREANLPFSLVAGRRARAAIRACRRSAYANVDGVNLPARLLLMAKLMRAARALVRADLKLDVRLGELRHVGWQRPLGQGGIDFDQVLTDASGVLRRFGFAGAWSSVNLRLAEADGTLLIAPAVRFIGWGGSSASVAAYFDAIAHERLLLTPDGDPERGLMSRPIEEEETMFRAIAFALDQRFGLLDRIDGVIIPRDVWGDGISRAYETQTDVDMRYATPEQLGGLRGEMIGIPLSELIRANGSGRPMMDRAMTAVGRTPIRASFKQLHHAGDHRYDPHPQKG